MTLQSADNEFGERRNESSNAVVITGVNYNDSIVRSFSRSNTFQ